MRKLLKASLFKAALGVGFALLTSVAFGAPADTRSQSLPISRVEFEALAAELAPKVNLFRDVWKVDPQAEFFGGTSRDYLYWLKGKLRRARTQADAEKLIAELKVREVIDVREFILFESDVDVISAKNHLVDGTRYGIKKIDQITPDRLDPKSAAGQDEIKQGYIPAEKIRLGQSGIAKASTFGDGVGEIFESRPTVVFASKNDFESTKFAKDKLNHPVLLALRYVRILAVDYHQAHGKGYPNANVLFGSIDPASGAAVSAVLSETLSSGELKPYLANSRFRNWLNLAIQKAFRSYTNPTATKMLMEHFGADRLPLVYEGLEPINQYLFVKVRDEVKIEAELAKAGVTPAELYETPAKFLPDGMLYHGTRNEQAFRSILFQGILPSAGGMGGDGLYGVSLKNKEFSEHWGGSKDRLVRLPVSKDAKIIDVRSGIGAKLMSRFGGDYSAFAEKFGADILVYPYQVQAFVVKNARVLGTAEGVTRVLLPFEELRSFVRSQKNLDLFKFMTLVSDNGLNEQEATLLRKDVPADLTARIRSKSFQQWMSDANFRYVLTQLRSNLLVVPEISELLRDAISELKPTDLAAPPKWIIEFSGGNPAHKAEVDKQLFEHARALVADPKAAFAKKPLAKVFESPAIQYVLANKGSALALLNFKEKALGEIANWTWEETLKPPLWYADALKHWEDHNLLMEPRRLRAEALLAERLARVEPAPLSRLQKSKVIRDAIEMSNAGTYLSLLKLPLFRKSLEISTQHWDLARPASFSETSWDIAWNSTDKYEIQKIQRQRVAESIRGWGEARFGSALGSAHRKNEAFVWLMLFAARAETLGLPTASSFTNAIGSKSIRDYAYDRQNKMIPPELLTPATMLAYMTELSKGEFVDKQGRNFQMLQLFYSFSQLESNLADPRSLKVAELLVRSRNAGAISSAYHHLPEKWTGYDRLLEQAFYRVGTGKASEAELGSLKSGWASGWVHRIPLAPDRVRPEALIGMAITLDAPTRVGSMGALKSFGEWDALIRVPNLRRDARGAHVVEMVLEAPNLDEFSENVPDFRKHLEHVIKVTFAGHPRQSAWIKALEVERNDEKPNANSGPRRKFLQGIPKSGSHSCEILFRTLNSTKWTRNW